MYRISLPQVLVWAAVFAAILPAADMARAQTPQELNIAGVDVAVWPPTSGPGPYPLVLFSHGLGGCKTQSTYLMEALAQHGMLVVAPDHNDRGERCPAEPPSPAELERILGPHEHRRDAIRKLLGALPVHPRLSGWTIDSGRVALVGHSLGGFTVLGLAGALPSWQVSGIAAVVALAPYVQLFPSGDAVKSISVPVLLQSGTADKLTPPANQDNIFAKLTAPACKVVYLHAGHLAWTDHEPEFHEATAAATIAFLDEVFAGHRPTKAVLASPKTDGGQDCKP